MPTTTRLAVELHALSGADTASAGALAASLGELARAGFAVVEGRLLTTDAHRMMMELDPPPDAAPDPSRRERLLHAPLPPQLREAVRGMAERWGDGAVLVRRSTPTRARGEADAPLRDVHGPAQLEAAIRSCWLAGDAATAVLVQPQPSADVWGRAVCDDATVTVEARTEVGDPAAAPDVWHVDGDQVTARQATQQALTSGQAYAVADLARRADGILGGPSELGWVMTSGRLLVLTARRSTDPPDPVRPDPVLPAGTWIKEVERYPEPFTAFGASVAAPAISAGLTAMFAHYGAMIERAELRMIDGEAYLRMTPLGGHDGPPPPAWMLGILARTVPALSQRVRRATIFASDAALEDRQHRWESEERPALQGEIARLRARDLTAMDDAALLNHLRAVLDLVQRALRLHFDLIPPYVVPVHELVTCCSRVLGWDERDALDLLAGCSPATSSPTLALAAVAERIRTSPALRMIVEQPAPDLADRLTAADAETGALLEGWIDDIGLRPIHDDPGSPLFAEEPGLIARLLLEAVNHGDPQVGAQTAVVARERARRELAGHPAGLRRFEHALAAAVRAYPIREDSAWWTGSLPAGLGHLVVLEYGRRLVDSGQLDRADDVVDLPAESLLASLAARVGEIVGKTEDLRALARRHRAARDRVRNRPGPARYGPAPVAPPNIRGLPALSRRLNAALLWSRPADNTAATSEEPIAPLGAVTGIPGSAGTHTGPVRLVLGAADFPRVRHGDVIVCRTTDPAWSVLFGIAGALVTDTGGLLSHAGIVAREQHIPAVLGTAVATQTFRDDQVVTVDGNTGRVVLTHPADTNTEETS